VFRRFYRIGVSPIIMCKKLFITIVCVTVLASCSSSSQFGGWKTEVFAKTPITGSSTKTFQMVNSDLEEEQHLRAVAFDRGSNATGNFRIDDIKVGNKSVDSTDIVIPPGEALSVTVTYAPRNLETTKASYGGWRTGDEKRWIPTRQEDIDKETAGSDLAIHRSIIEMVYDYPKEGIYFVQLVGEAMAGPNGELSINAGGGTCIPGDGVMCYSGGFAIDIPQLSPGGPKSLELTGPVRMTMSGGGVKLMMDDFPYAIMHLSNADTPQLPSGVTVSIIINGSEGVEADGTFDGSRLTLKGASFRIRAALGKLDKEQVEQGISALVDFDISDLDITTSTPVSQGNIVLTINTKIPKNPSGNDLFDQFLSNADVNILMDGHLEY